MAKSGAIVHPLGTGWFHQPVPYSSLCFWYRLVALTGSYIEVLVPGVALTRYQTPYL